MKGYERNWDYPPPRFYTEPVPSGPNQGHHLSKAELDILLDAYRTKLHRPPVARDHLHRDHLHRDHLLARLNQHSHRSLTLVSAPAGYGKSTLMCCWLEECDAPSAWVSLDENDNDLRLFLSYFIAAVQTIFPTACAETLSMLGWTSCHRFHD